MGWRPHHDDAAAHASVVGGGTSAHYMATDVRRFHVNSTASVDTRPGGTVRPLRAAAISNRPSGLRERVASSWRTYLTSSGRGSGASADTHHQIKRPAMSSSLCDRAAQLCRHAVLEAARTCRVVTTIRGDAHRCTAVSRPMVPWAGGGRRRTAHRCRRCASPPGGRTWASLPKEEASASRQTRSSCPNRASADATACCRAAEHR